MRTMGGGVEGHAGFLAEGNVIAASGGHVSIFAACHCLKLTLNGIAGVESGPLT